MVAMSGGVDSTVAAAILKDQGHEVIGISMELVDSSHDSDYGRCCSPLDLYDARRAADKLGINHYVINMRDAFTRLVVEPFVSAYIEGRTPNPCILCNEKLKFDVLLKFARELDAEALATGHYARIIEVNGRLALAKGVDEKKDQSYFLFGLDEEMMRFTRFPLGEMTKDEVRKVAASKKLKVADKGESQEICFVPDGNYAAYVEERVEAGALRPGVVLDADGNVLGEHDGIHKFTIGQRRGIGISGPDRSYIVSMDATNGTVVLGPKSALNVRGLIAGDVSWRGPHVNSKGLEVSTKVRYRGREAPSTIYSEDEKNVMRVEFKNDLPAVAPGQAAVFYDGDIVLGGGWIERTFTRSSK